MAHLVFATIGADAFAERARRELGATVRPRLSVNLSQLTAQDTKIAALAARGATNTEIASQLCISARTVH
jgi:DNA-binding NarL/FixJ family response regulator